ncbi:hypothetical protein [uncultured Polaribacter sp.]|uniref:hypothetical protein n=1 Tax=uncultured Polaribacter sp. TaxID=174711 RepID=UPI00260DDDF9|nr:hypothetical protein [uncultured Polaribacter sp.]
MTINNITEQSKNFGNSHTINKINDTILIHVSKTNKWKLLIVGLITILTPTLLTQFIPMENESDIIFYNKIKLICYAFPVLLVAVYFLQKKQTTKINTITKLITHKNETIQPDEVIDFEIEYLKKRQLQVYSIYLTTKTNQKILIGATTSSEDRVAMENYAKTILNFIKS